MELNDLAKHILLRDSTPPKDFNEPMDPEKKKRAAWYTKHSVLTGFGEWSHLKGCK